MAEVRRPLSRTEPASTLSYVNPFTSFAGTALCLIGLRAASRVTRRYKAQDNTHRVKLRKKPDLPIQWYDKNLGYRIRGRPGWNPWPNKFPPQIRWCIRFRKRIKIRKLVHGTCAKPRLAVFRSLNHIYVNVVDDSVGHGVILANSSTRQMKNLQALREMQGCEKGKETTWNEQAAELIGKDIAAKCLEKKIFNIVFDRGGFAYSGRVKALKEAASIAGLMVDMWKPNGRGAQNLAQKM